jgi:peptide/nickel transport system substrate-binding protein
MHRSVRLATGIAASGAMLVVAACSTASDSGPNAPKDATDSTIPELSYGVNAIPATLDVANNYNSPDMALMGLVTQPLEIPNIDGTFTGVLAEKVTQPDRQTLVYDLRDDATFSHGTPLAPEDVVWTIEHLREPDTHTGSELADFDTVEVTGDHQVTITLKRPNNAIRGAFAIISFIHDKEYAEEAGDDLGTPDAPPIGTGPYVITSFDSNALDLARNDEYVDEAPAPDSIAVRLVSDDTAAQLAMHSGEMDVYPLIDIKTTTTWSSVPGAVLYSSPTMIVDYVTMNGSIEPFDDIHVRRAIAYATDVEGLVKANYGEEAQPPVAMVPSQVIDIMAPDAQAAAALDAPFADIEFDMDKAREELALSDHPDGFTAEFEFPSPAGRIVGLSLAENLSELGITLELKQRRVGEFLGDLFAGKVPDIGFFSIAAVVPDPASWYIYVIGPDNPYNVAKYSTPVTDEALTVINEGDDDGARWEAMRTISEELAENIPYVGLAQPNFVVAGAEDVTFTSTPDFIEMTSGNWIHSLKSTE